MAIISITTTQNIELNYDLASVGERLVAQIIDLLIIGGYWILIALIFSSANFPFVLDFIIALPMFIYSPVCETFFNGQSVGKRVMEIKVISLSGNPASIGQYLIRWMFRVVDIVLGFGAVAVIAVAISKKQQRVGDMVAGTIMVKTKPRANLGQTLYMPVLDESYQVVYPEVINLRDSDMQLVKEVILNVRKSNNYMIAWQTVRKLEEVLNITNRYSDPLTFLHVILTDYNHLTGMEK